MTSDRQITRILQKYTFKDYTIIINSHKYTKQSVLFCEIKVGKKRNLPLNNMHFPV